MSRVKIGTAGPSWKAIEAEIAHLRGLDLMMLRKRWRTLFRRAAPDHLPRHLLFKMIAYRVQANYFGDLEPKYQRLLDEAPTPEAATSRLMICVFQVPKWKSKACCWSSPCVVPANDGEDHPIISARASRPARNIVFVCMAFALL